MAELTGLRIDQLPKASMIRALDLLVLQQDETAKQVEGQILLSWLTAAADGHGGIKKIELVKTEGLIDHYQITFADTSTFEFTVTNGQKGDPGDRGDKGDPPELKSSSVEYQVGDSGTDDPTGEWLPDVPYVPNGKYLWTRVVQTFETGSPVTYYSVSRFGIDGKGSVNSVAGKFPDLDGNVTVEASDVGAVPKNGGSMTGALSMGGNGIADVADPKKSSDVATKNYVDTNKVSFAQWKNEDKTEAFTGKVELDLSKAFGVFITFVASTTGSTYVASGMIPIDGTSHIVFYHTTSGTTTRRTFRASTTGVTFADGYSGSDVNNSVLIPTKIRILNIG